MTLTGAAAVLFLDMELVEVMAKSGLFMFAAAWILAFIFECLYRIAWYLDPTYAPQELRVTLNTSQSARRKQKLNNGATSAGLIASLCKLAKPANNMLLLFGSQLFNRIMTPLRSWDKQNLWHADEGGEERPRRKSQTMAGVDRGDLLRESNRTDADLKPLNGHDQE